MWTHSQDCAYLLAFRLAGLSVPANNHPIHIGFRRWFIHQISSFTHKNAPIRQIVAMPIKTHATALALALTLATALLLLWVSPGSALGTSQKATAVLPASGVWLRVPVIPWPNWMPGHRGLDIQAPADTEVFAPVTGEVLWIGRVGKTFGITIDAGSFIKHTITGIDSSLEIGQKVWRGQFIGWSIVNQHCENLDCIHWSVRQHGRYIDPRWLLKPVVYRLPTRVDGLADRRS